MGKKILVVVASFCLLAATKPSREKYLTWTQQQISGSANATLLTVFARPFIDGATSELNLIVFNVFLTRFDEQHAFAALGVLSNFFPLPAAKQIWTPGQPSPSAPHVIAAAEQGRWLPEDGYVWIKTPPDGDLRVRWDVGRLSTQHPHVIAAPAEQRWLPADGYSWIVDPPPPGDFRVRWTPNQLMTGHPHVVAANNEGRWLPANGYVWINNPPIAGDFRVVWRPGTFMRGRPDLFAGPIEGQWIARE